MQSDAIAQPSKAENPASSAMAPWLWWPVAALITLAVFGWWRYGRPHRAAVVELAPATLTTRLRGAGDVDARVHAFVAARVSSRLEQVMAEAGETVAAGQALARLADDLIAPQCDIAIAQAASADAAVEMARHDLSRAETTLKRAQQESGRYTTLLATNSAAVAAVDVDTTQSALADATALQARAAAALAQAQAAAVAAHRNADSQSAQLAETNIAAPFAATVTKRMHSPGDVVGAGTPLFELVDPRSLIVTGRFDAALLGVIAPGQPARVWLDQAPDQAREAVVARIQRAVDGETRQFTAELEFQAIPATWALAERAHVELSGVEVACAKTIPVSFLAPRSDGAGVWVERKGRSRWTPVVTGRSDELRVEIVSGLDPMDHVLAPSGRYSFEPVKSLNFAP